MIIHALRWQFKKKIVGARFFFKDYRFSTYLTRERKKSTNLSHNKFLEDDISKMLYIYSIISTCYFER